MTVKELHAQLGELLETHGDWEVAHNEGQGPTLRRITSVSVNPDRGAHSWPAFVRLDGERWNDSDWRSAIPSL